MGRRIQNYTKIPEKIKSRSSHPEVFLRKSVLKICSKFTGEHPCRKAISIKLLCWLETQSANQSENAFYFILKALFILNPLSSNPTKWPNPLKQFVGNLPTNCFSVFDHVVGLAFKGLTGIIRTDF